MTTTFRWKTDRDLGRLFSARRAHVVAKLHASGALRGFRIDMDVPLAAKKLFLQSYDVAVHAGRTLLLHERAEDLVDRDRLFRQPPIVIGPVVVSLKPVGVDAALHLTLLRGQLALLRQRRSIRITARLL